MSNSLNVIALISGGKDSLYTLLHCIQNRHRVVALANLYPTPLEGVNSDATENEDINSFMYQTVGHSVIPLYADALRLPLYRQQITGISSQSGRYYDPSLIGSSSDETEDLVPLLERVRKDHPEADAVCSGAILSTYQRTRIESVALRLNLTPLAYLWQYPFLPPPASRLDSLTGLLEDMKAAGCESRIIKIASGGMLDDLLWSDVTHPKTMNRVVASMAPFFENDEPALRGAVLGEGGEFETLALDGPRAVWKSKIAIMHDDNAIVSEEGGVKWLRVGQSRVAEVEVDAEGTVSDGIVRVPSYLDPQFEYITTMHISAPHNTASTLPSAEDTLDGQARLREALEVTTVKLSLESDTLCIANITTSNASTDAAQQMEDIVSYVKKTLLHISETNNIKPPLSPSSIISTTILLAAMSSFPSVNTSYARLFPSGLPNPPARVTIACSLPRGTLVSLSCIVSLLPRDAHRGLHVQSRSYWAPANIGPYSQAICVPGTSDDEQRDEFVHVAGQIPLVPATMEILQAPFTHQALLSLQHLWRVGQERGVDLWVWGVAFLPRLAAAGTEWRPGIAAGVWKQAHRTTVHGKSVSAEAEDDDADDSGPDAWDLRHGRTGARRVIPTVGKHRHVLPNSTVFVRSSDGSWIPPVIVAAVDELPRSAPIEWHSHGLGGLPKHPGRTPRIAVKSCSFLWGTVSACSYGTVRQSARDDSDEESPRMRHSEGNDHHFVTVQVFTRAGTEKEPKVLTLSEVLECALPCTYALPSEDEPSADEAEPEKGTGQQTTGMGKHYSCVHGIVYMTGNDGEATVVGLETMPGLTMISCRQLWGAGCHSGAVGADEAGVMELSLAMMLRIDMNAAARA